MLAAGVDKRFQHIINVWFNKTSREARYSVPGCSCGRCYGYGQGYVIERPIRAHAHTQQCWRGANERRGANGLTWLQSPLAITKKKTLNGLLKQSLDAFKLQHASDSDSTSIKHDWTGSKGANGRFHHRCSPMLKPGLPRSLLANPIIFHSVTKLFSSLCTGA